MSGAIRTFHFVCVNPMHFGVALPMTTEVVMGPIIIESPEMPAAPTCRCGGTTVLIEERITAQD